MDYNQMCIALGRGRKVDINEMFKRKAKPNSYEFDENDENKNNDKQKIFASKPLIARNSNNSKIQNIEMNLAPKSTSTCSPKQCNIEAMSKIPRRWRLVPAKSIGLGCSLRKT